MSPEQNPELELLTAEEVAKILDLKVETLEKWRVKAYRAKHRYPLAHVRVGRNCRYTRKSVADFIAARTVQPPVVEEKKTKKARSKKAA
jgi:hypothetical protein